VKPHVQYTEIITVHFKTRTTRMSVKAVCRQNTGLVVSMVAHKLTTKPYKCNTQTVLWYCLI